VVEYEVDGFGHESLSHEGESDPVSDVRGHAGSVSDIV
jgi:hypothetical protein